MGTPVVALCGKVWVPSRAPEKFPVCPECQEIWESLKPGGKGDGGLRRMTGRHPEGAAPLTPALPVAWPDRAAWGTAPSLRAWQQAAMTTYFAGRRATSSRSPRPGAGKTTFALSVAAELLGRRQVDRITVVAPTEHLKVQWAEAAARAGIPIDPAYSAGKGKTSEDYVGVAVTYAGVAVNPLAHADPHRAVQDPRDPRRGAPRRRRPVVGRGGARGVRARARRLALTGTPFRSDVNPIPFVTYAPDDDGVPRSVADYTYGYARRAGRPRRPAGAVHGLLGRDAVAHPRRRRGRGPARRAADQGPHGAGAAHRPRPGGRVDAGGARGRRPAAVRGPPARARRGRPGHRHRPGLRPRLRRAAAGRITGEEPPSCSRTRRPRRRRSPTFADGDAAGWSRSGWSPRASTSRGWRSASTPRRPRRRCSSPRPSAVSCGPASAARRRRCSCRRCRPCSASPRRWRSSATTCSAGGSATRATSSPPSRTCSPRPRRARRASEELDAAVRGARS